MTAGLEPHRPAYRPSASSLPRGNPSRAGPLPGDTPRARRLRLRGAIAFVVGVGISIAGVAIPLPSDHSILSWAWLLLSGVGVATTVVGFYLMIRGVPKEVWKVRQPVADEGPVKGQGDY